MSKPIFLFCPGVAKSSTTFLSKILTQNKAFHFGYLKESSYLDFIFYGEENFPKHFRPKYIYKNSGYSNYSYPDFDNFSKNYTIENYCKYYLDVYKQTKFVGGVGDFSQSYNLLPEKFLNEVKHELEKFFEVKCILLFRDPIKRLFSLSNMSCPDDANNFFLRLLYRDNILMNDIQFSSNYYQYVIEKFENIFPTKDIFISSMEEMYLENTFELLKTFLNLKTLEIIETSNNNKFSRTYKQKLSEQEISFAKKKLYGNYEYWKNKFGFLPPEWHQVV